ncbi:MAG: DUF3566 domain-containing protein [Acidimicrobiia bacterium]
MTATPDPPSTRATPDDTSTSVSSAGGTGRPPRRERRPARSVSSASTSTKPVAAPTAVPAPADAAPVEVELGDDDTGTTTTTRSRRRTTKPAKTKAPKTTRQPEARPVPVMAPDLERAPRGERRFRQTISKVDLWTVLKLSLCFYLSTMFVTLIAFVSLYIIADTAGVISSVENFLGDLLSAKDFTFLSGEVLRGAILITLVVVALQVVITVIAASFYNIFAELFGGLEMTVLEEEVTPR